MKAMLLAAGRGERLRPLTDEIPKPLLKVGAYSLIEWQILRLRRAGVTEFVINHAHLGLMIEQALGDGSRYGAHFEYSREPLGALETGGGIRRALPLLGPGPFIVVNADIWIEFDFSQLAHRPEGLGHLVLVPNPVHHAQGDFALQKGRISNAECSRYTFAGLAVYSPNLFSVLPDARFPLAPLLREAADTGALSGELHLGKWIDVGTPERLQEAQLRVAWLNRHGTGIFP